MSYSQHEWTTGETITAAKMNNIEEGITEATSSDYDFILSIDTNGYVVIESGTFASIYALMQTRPIYGIIKNLNIDQYTIDAWYIPLTYANYYSSSGEITLRGQQYWPSTGSFTIITVVWPPNDEPYLD